MAECFAHFNEGGELQQNTAVIFVDTTSRVESTILTFEQMKQYFTEKNALTVMVSIFCFIMMIIAFVKEQSLWQGIAFALAFSFSVEVICHRSKEAK